MSDELADDTNDPVERLLRSARDEAVEEEFHVTGVMMQYYEVCERELWFASRYLEIDRDNAAVVRGTQVDESAYEGKRRNVSVDGTIAIDVLDDGRVMEVKTLLVVGRTGDAAAVLLPLVSRPGRRRRTRGGARPPDRTQTRIDRTHGRTGRVGRRIDPGRSPSRHERHAATGRGEAVL